MKSTFTALLGLVLALPILGQSVANARSSASGRCNVAHTGNNDSYTINCNGIGEEQGKKMLELLNKILLNHDMADANAKLDQLLAIVTDLGPPKILISKLPIQLTSSSPGHPRTAVEFYTDRPDEGGQFGVVCDRACNPVDMCNLAGQNSGEMGHIAGELSTAVFLFRRQFPALTECYLTVESADDKPVSIIKVTHLLITNGKDFILGPVQPSHCTFSGAMIIC